MSEENTIEHIYGGYLKDIPVGKYKRRFDDKRRKRRVAVKFHMYYGAGKHYYVSLNEEFDPIVVGNKSYRCWDDKVGKGKYLDDKFSSEEEARRGAMKMFRDNFSFKTHKLIECDTNKKWYYKEGD